MNRSLHIKTNSILIPALIFLTTFLLSGCGTVQIGRDFDLTAFESIAAVGKTSKAQVMDLLGSPKSTGIMQETSGKRYDEWVYISGAGEMPGMKDTKFKILQIRFDQAGILRSYNWSSSK